MHKVTILITKEVIVLADYQRIKTDIEFLKHISEPCPNGTTRIGFTPEYRHGTDYIKKCMAEAGLIIREDSIGNIYGLLEGQKSDAPVILSGSHLDSVRCGGSFDGIAGVVCALEVARMLNENGVELKHSYEVIGIIEEEGTRFGQVLLGSQFVTGALGESALDEIIDHEGMTLRNVLSEYRFPDTCPALRSDKEISVFLELHDEQGPILENELIDIGIVENIAAVSWLTVTVDGFAGHAGTVPMNGRQDAGIGAYRFIDIVNCYVTEKYTTTATATVGRLELFPASTNCIPSKCIFTFDVRSGNVQYVNDITDFIMDQSKKIGQICNVDITVKVDSFKESVKMDLELHTMIEKSSSKLGYSYRKITSGAGHDAMIFAEKWKTAMIFVPCKNGITHNPSEFVHWSALAKGANVLYQTILRADEQL